MLKATCFPSLSSGAAGMFAGASGAHFNNRGGPSSGRPVRNVIERLSSKPNHPIAQKLLSEIQNAQKQDKKIVLLFQPGAGRFNKYLSHLPDEEKGKVQLFQAFTEQGFAGCSNDLKFLAEIKSKDDTFVIVIDAMNESEVESAASNRAVVEGSNVIFIDDPDMLLADLFEMKKHTVSGKSSLAVSSQSLMFIYAPEAWVLDSTGAITQKINGLDTYGKRKLPSNYINEIFETNSNNNDNQIASNEKQKTFKK